MAHVTDKERNEAYHRAYNAAYQRRLRELYDARDGSDPACLRLLAHFRADNDAIYGLPTEDVVK